MPVVSGFLLMYLDIDFAVTVGTKGIHGGRPLRQKIKAPVTGAFILFVVALCHTYVRGDV